MTKRTSQQRGLTIIEVLLAVAIASLLLGVLVLFARRGFDVSREHTEQARITEEVRIHMERMSDNIRNARSVDINGDGIMTPPEESWVQEASPNQLIVYTNIDADNDIEKVRYYLEGSELKLGVFDPYSTASERTTVLSRFVRNLAAGQPLFTYQLGAGAITSAPGSPSSTALVGIHLVVDVNEQQYPAAATIETLVGPRGTAVLTGTTGSGGGSTTPPPVFVTYNVNGTTTVHTHRPPTTCPAHGHFVTWYVTNATSCTASGVWSGTKPTNGIETVLTQGGGHFTLECVGPGGSASATIPMNTDAFASCN